MAIPRKTTAIVRTLLRSELPLQLLVVCGMNHSLKRKMHYLARNVTARMHVYGFTQRISLMMTAADLMIGKPGPGSIMEAVIKELPLLLDNVTEPMPQELGNLNYAMVHGIALPITAYRRLPQLVERLMFNSTGIPAHSRKYAPPQARKRHLRRGRHRVEPAPRAGHAF